MTNYKTKTGRTLTSADIDALADEVETTDYDVKELKSRRGRPASKSPRGNWPPWSDDAK